MKQQIKVGGVDVTVVDDKQAEQADFLVCLPSEEADRLGAFSDNVLAACGLCGCLISHRPYMPVRPMKVCMKCAMQHAASQRH